jgi:hypothetical protein
MLWALVFAMMAGLLIGSLAGCGQRLGDKPQVIDHAWKAWLWLAPQSGAPDVLIL